MLLFLIYLVNCTCAGIRDLGKCYPDSDTCICKHNFNGAEDCSECSDGYYGYPDCKGCDKCYYNGTNLINGLPSCIGRLSGTLVQTSAIVIKSLAQNPNWYHMHARFYRMHFFTILYFNYRWDSKMPMPWELYWRPMQSTGLSMQGGERMYG